MDPLPPCPFAPKKQRGAHELSYLFGDDMSGTGVQMCDRCGMVRSFTLAPIPADDLTADEIDRLLVRRA